MRSRAWAFAGVILAMSLGLGLALTGRARAADPAPVRIVSAWIRQLPAGVPAGGYLALENQSNRPVALTSVSSAAFGEVDLHRTISEHGVMSMQPVDRIVIAPHSTLEFAAQGYHLMLMRPVHPLTPGEQVPLTLHFQGAPDLQVAAEVRTHE